MHHIHGYYIGPNVKLKKVFLNLHYCDINLWFIKNAIAKPIL